MPRYQLTIAGKHFEVEVQSMAAGLARVLVNGRPYEVTYRPAGETLQASSIHSITPASRPVPPLVSAGAAVSRPAPPPPSPAAAPAGPGAVTAPMPGVILEVLVKVGDQVQVGDTVVKLEAMKMENDIKTPVAGVVAEVPIHKGANVTVGEVLVVIAAG